MNESNYMENISPDMLETIIRHLQKVASQPDEKQLAAWLEEDAQNLARFEEVKRMWSLTTPVEGEFHPDVDSAWIKVQAKINPETPSMGISAKGKQVFFPQLFMSAAASLLLLIGFGFLLRAAFTTDGTEHSLATTSEMQKVVLPDSSYVWLNRNSRLTWTDFEGDSREVTLEGEAFFEVTRRPEQPFRITGGKSVTEVLGTSFRLKTEKGHPDVLEVVTGKVAFTPTAKPENRKEFLPGQRGEIGENGVVVRSQSTDPNALAWKKRELSFSNTGLKQVCESLESYFHVRIDLKDPAIQNCHFTGTFEKPELKDVMQVLSVSAGLKAEQKGETWELSGAGCP